MYLDRGFVIAAPEIPISAAMIEALKEWGFKTITSEGESGKKYSTDGTGLSEAAAETESTDSLESEQIKKADALFLDLQKFVEALFVQMSNNVSPKINLIAEKVRDLCNATKHDRRYLLRVLKDSESADSTPTTSYLISHTVKSTILAIIIGSYLKLPNHRLIELGVAAVLHEAGMLSLPPEIYTSTGVLSQEDHKAILSHPMLGFKLLKSFDLPLAVIMAALEHHERENGKGYPQHLTGDKISLYSKIIAVACSYEAQTNKRSYKMTKDGYSGMVNMLKNEGKQYDDTVIRALVFSLSIYPIGLYVLLSDDRKAQVVDVNPEDPRYPLVQLQETGGGGKIRILKTSQKGVHIVRPLASGEQG
ncbi:phosphohydrolase [Spirochaetia bacterium]|nr:phosphohydrolase [Spirochaetia bacterium]